MVIKNAAGLRTARPDPATEPPLVLSMGRLKAPKDFWTLVRALASLPNGSCRLRIAGDGPERAALSEERRAAEGKEPVTTKAKKSDDKEDKKDEDKSDDKKDKKNPFAKKDKKDDEEEDKE